MTRLTPIPVHNLRVFRTIRSGKGARETVPPVTDSRKALGTRPFGLGVACVGCFNKSGALITAMIYRDGLPMCACCAGKQQEAA